MSEYLYVEKPFLDQLATLGWQVTDQGQGMIPSDPAKSLRTNFREWLLPKVFRDAVRALNHSAEGKPWLTDHQLDDLRDQILRQPNRALLEHMRRTKASSSKPRWIIMNEVPGEPDPIRTMIDFTYPHAISFRLLNSYVWTCQCA